MNNTQDVLMAALLNVRKGFQITVGNDIYLSRHWRQENEILLVWNYGEVRLALNIDMTFFKNILVSKPKMLSITNNLAFALAM